jgi:hypothetical protein
LEREESKRRRGKISEVFEIPPGKEFMRSTRHKLVRTTYVRGVCLMSIWNPKAMVAES